MGKCEKEKMSLLVRVMIRIMFKNYSVENKQYEIFGKEKERCLDFTLRYVSSSMCLLFLDCLTYIRQVTM